MSMSSNKGVFNDIWLQTVSEEEEKQQETPSKIEVVYRRRRTEESKEVPAINRWKEAPQVMAIPKARRTSWSHSLSVRGRTSICIPVGLYNIPHHKQETKKDKKHGLPKGRSSKPNPPDLREQRAYFQEVDETELFEESPSPKQLGTWAMGAQAKVVVHDLSAIMERWRISKPVYNYTASEKLFRIVETPVVGSNFSLLSDRLNEEAGETSSRSRVVEKSNICQGSATSKPTNEESNGYSLENYVLASLDALQVAEESEQQHIACEKDDQHAFTQLLMACGQTGPSTLSEVISQFCDPSAVVKIGEGTYGEVFKAENIICKIVPIDGDSLVNGEIQKRSREVLEEALLSLTLNSLRGEVDSDVTAQNTCKNFVEAKGFQVCQGSYCDSLLNAWEKWDAANGSENDNPKEFNERQVYIVFIQADGGDDLESFVLLNFDEARGLLTQVTAALAVAEVACKFEHRDLHWGNILVERTSSPMLNFTIEGKKMQARTFGIMISIIDFTLSRVSTGDAVLFLDLSLDPGIFEGPKGDIQFETYRKMREITEECWEGSFPKTNVLWLQYLVEILLLKKSYKRTAKDARDLRALKKRLNSYESAKDALSDIFFQDILICQTT